MAGCRDSILPGHLPVLPTCRVAQGGSSRVAVTLIDTRTNSAETQPLDCVSALSFQDDGDYANWVDTGGTVKVLAADMWTSSSTLMNVECEPVEPTEGTFTFVIPVVASELAGLYLLDVGLYNSDGQLVVVNSGYLDVIPSLSSLRQTSPVLTSAYIRRRMRDSHAGSNTVLEECQFGDVEIYDAIQNALGDLNSAHPQIRQQWTLKTFPTQWNSRLIDGILGGLYEMAATWYLRNDLELSGAGQVTSNDMNKAGGYTKLADKHRERWLEWATITKRRINISGAWGTAFSR
jgi:hypothetical protein